MGLSARTENKEKTVNRQPLPGFESLIRRYPARLWTALKAVSEQRGIPLFLVGGPVRDFFLGREPVDIDLTVIHGATACARLLIKELGEGTFVPLGCRQEDAARVVWRGLGIDFSSFRQGALTLEEDLERRDYTINSMGVDLSPQFVGDDRFVLIDPLNGLDDLHQGIIRSCPSAFRDDPLRLLRGYRLATSLDMRLDPVTREEIIKHASLLQTVSVERISHELDRIMETGNSCREVGQMAETAILFQIFPELRQGVGLEQPGFHHLDVFHHSLEALCQVERIIRHPEDFYPGHGRRIQEYVGKDGMKRLLKWAALFHDLGKPPTMAVNHAKGGRVTFYGHDQVGSEIFRAIGGRLKWRNREIKLVSRLIKAHMHPFHLCNVRRTRKLSRKAIVKLCKRAGEDLTGLFILAMADSLAGKGEMKPDGMEQELAALFTAVTGVYHERIRPVMTGARLITGHDLIKIFHLQSGAHFSTILDRLEMARIEGQVTTREEALDWVGVYLREDHS